MNKIIIAVAISMIFSGQTFATENNGTDKGNSAGRPDNRPPSNRPPAHPVKPEKPGKPGGGTQPVSNTVNQTASPVANAAATGLGVGVGVGGNPTATGGYSSASIGPMTFAFTAPAGGGGNSFVQHDYSGMPNNTPAMGNTYVNSSNGCDGAVGASLVLPGFGGSLSASTLRMMCEGRLNAQAHKSLGQDEKAKLTMVVVQEYACEEDPKWAKIARKMGLCAPDEIAAAATQTNPAFNSN